MPNKLNLKSRAILYICLLLLGSVVPIGPRSSDILMDNYTLDIRWDYLVHAFIYLPLPIILFRSFRSMKWGSFTWLVFFSLVIPALFEVLQMLIPYRNFNINDLMANGFGVIIGWVLALFFRKRLSPSGSK